MLFTAVYASPMESKRCRLWDLLYKLACDIADPWLLAGDFNEIKTPTEQQGGGRVSEIRCHRFNEWIEDCSLIDIEAQGPFFTWKGPKWDGLDRVYKRLDRCLCSISWHEKFAEVEISVLPRVCSDHHPLLIQLSKEYKGTRKRLFKYEAMWKMHDHFDRVLETSWRREGEAHLKLAALQLDLTKWNKEVFGQLEGRKRRLYNRNCNLFESCKGLKTDSELWRKLVQIWPNVVENIYWEIGDGVRTRFWEDKWVEDGSKLAARCVGQLTSKERQMKSKHHDQKQSESGICLRRAARKITYKKRKKLNIQVSELITLCGIQACAVLFSSYESKPEESFTRKRIAKVSAQLKKQLKENSKKELNLTMFQCAEGGSVDDEAMVDPDELDSLAQENINIINNKMLKFI
ncbi:hypothetical protein K1719_036983 [Acacia pycnantha]|nr:hypothetical protein K1719_036983 [Acacia pycnantha]